MLCGSDRHTHTIMLTHVFILHMPHLPKCRPRFKYTHICHTCHVSPQTLNHWVNVQLNQNTCRCANWEASLPLWTVLPLSIPPPALPRLPPPRVTRTAWSRGLSWFFPWLTQLPEVSRRPPVPCQTWRLDGRWVKNADFWQAPYCSKGGDCMICRHQISSSHEGVPLSPCLSPWSGETWKRRLRGGFWDSWAAIVIWGS